VKGGPDLGQNPPNHGIRARRRSRFCFGRRIFFW
jgi:hypothetical protein